MNAEQRRLDEARSKDVPWRKWGPYLSERQWGTVREDYSDSGDAWNSFPHDHARSRAYRWGEDGLAGISDDQQWLCFGLALWNGRDPILKERLFGLTNSEGNHGEDVKEYYFYLDSTPTHSYMKYLYKYPQAAYPYRVEYLPAESDTGMFGGNSNWRGPIWMPVNALILRALLNYYAYYGDDFTIECPTGSGRRLTLYQVAEEISRRLVSIFLRDAHGRRPVYGDTRKFQDDPHWRDLILFYEYFHGDNGAGLGASHQTGWTGIIARIMHLFATTTPEQVLELGKAAAIIETEVAPAKPSVASAART